ncbi:MAG TPA: nucleoside hydrolase [candidate division Zixibacteria bacterium]|nr:nucleoside hydrolase [candidate division Zixibacteria bacterium]
MTRIVLDCDPGHDDALAILLAAAHPALELAAITTVAGNQTLEKVTLNARRVCSVAGIRHVPIAAGCDRPLVRDQLVAGEIHGASGLDGPDWPEPTVGTVDRHAVDLILSLAAEDTPLSVVATGPLTNLATALRREPGLARRLERVVLMGGAIGLGNWTPAAEFNIYADPEAADLVFTAGIPVTMVPLEVTHQALATEEVLARIDALGTPVGRMAGDLLRFFADTYEKVFGFPAPAVHDPCAVAWVIDPSLVETRPMNVAIELRSELTYGRTVCDVYGTTGRPPNAEVGMSLAAERFWDLMIGALASYNR